ncbi:MAG: glycosyltransferase family 2 protein [Isosphaeraceae bacterium]
MMSRHVPSLPNWLDVDVVMLSRDLAPLRGDVLAGINIQSGVRLVVHRVVGKRLPGDITRWETIARARNAGKRLGSAPWIMYLDDDVVLGQGCVARLVQGLLRRSEFAALGADSAGEMRSGRDHWDYPRHVGMAATMFRRERLANLTFRWEPHKCECLCCCEDLRRAGLGIGYLQGATAWHRPISRRGAARPNHSPAEDNQRGNGSSASPPLTCRILAAFNRRDFHKFRRQFLRTLRGCGNREPVTAVAYGLYPSERDLLAALPGVEIVALPGNNVSPAIRRVRDFQAIVACWPDETPVAYWDAGDVLFQASLEPLWKLVRAYPNQCLAAREPMGYPDNPVIVSWTNTIRDPSARRRAFELMSTHPHLNAGFVAGTASAMMRYLKEADHLLNSPALHGVGPWGDQVAINVYCHSHPSAWIEVPDCWNYSLAGRSARTYRRFPNGCIESVNGSAVHVVHGNAGTLGRSAFPFLL